MLCRHEIKEKNYNVLRKASVAAAAATATEKAAHPEQRHFVNVSLLLIISPGALWWCSAGQSAKRKCAQVCVCAYSVCVCACVMIYLCCCLATESNQLEFNIVK